MRKAVEARIRHAHTDYDRLMWMGAVREGVRKRVKGRVEEVKRSWMPGGEESITGKEIPERPKVGVQRLPDHV